jgi:serine protease Do
VRTDCTLVGGDSGGPLFDLDGKVIAIHSRIGTALSDNLHVPIDTYSETWERLAGGESWGMSLVGGRPGGPYLGFQVDPDASDCRVGELDAGSPVGAAGIRKGDVITRFGGQRIANAGELGNILSARRAGDEVSVEVRRDDKTMTFKVTVGRRPPATRPWQPQPAPVRPPLPQPSRQNP